MQPRGQWAPHAKITFSRLGNNHRLFPAEHCCRIQGHHELMTDSGPPEGYGLLLHSSLVENGAGPCHFRFQKAEVISEFTGTCKVTYWRVRIISEEYHHVGETKTVILANSIFSSVSNKRLLKPKVLARRWPFLGVSHIPKGISHLEIGTHSPGSPFWNSSPWQLEWFPVEITTSSIIRVAPFGVL